MRYNSSLETLKKAESWYQRTDVLFSEQLKYRDKFQKVISECSDTIDELVNLGEPIRPEHIENGFDSRGWK